LNCFSYWLQQLQPRLFDSALNAQGADLRQQDHKVVQDACSSLVALAEAALTSRYAVCDTFFFWGS
jgi:hypothetical protein